MHGDGDDTGDVWYLFAVGRLDEDDWTFFSFIAGCVTVMDYVLKHPLIFHNLYMPLQRMELMQVGKPKDFIT